MPTRSGSLGKLGAELAARMTARVMSELTTTFASAYGQRVTLDRLVDAETVRAFAQMPTGEKFLVVDSCDDSGGGEDDRISQQHRIVPAMSVAVAGARAAHGV